jgi:hypothetical protein
MPYYHDLRCDYFSIDLNIGWFYHSMSESFLEFEFRPTITEGVEQTEEEGVKRTIDEFEKHIEEAFHDWTVYKVIGFQKGDHKYEKYDDVWEFLYDIAETYACDHPEVVAIQLTGEEVDDYDDE